MWRPGIEQKLVDCFSRHPVEVPGEDDLAGEIEMEHTFCTLRRVRALDCDTGEHIIDDQRLKNLRVECAKDDHYRNLIQVTTTGFPAKHDLLPPGVRPYWSICNELTVDEGIVLHHQQFRSRRANPNERVNDVTSPAGRDLQLVECACVVH